MIILVNLSVVILLLVEFRSCTEIDKTCIENILKHEDDMNSVNKVISLKTSPLAENEITLGSEDKRITMEVMLGNGAKTTKSVIMKSLPSTPALNEQIKESGLFNTEITAYKEALSKMEKLLLEHNDKGEILWVRDLDLRDYDQLILEDAVGEQGYKPVKKCQGLNLDHSKMAFKGLAKIHALSAVAKECNPALEKNLNESLLQRNYEKLKDFYEVIYNNFAKSIETKWGKEWLPYAEKVKKAAPNVKQRLLELNNDRSGFINVLNLGAPNIGTMFFKYGISELKQLETPIAVKYTYFQLANFNTPSHDVQYLLNTSPKLQVMVEHRDDLLKAYFHALIHYLKVFNYKGELPKQDEFIKEIERTNFEGLTVAIQILPLVFQPSTTPNYSESDAEKNLNSNTTIIDASGMYTAKYIEVMKVLLKKAVDDKVL